MTTPEKKEKSLPQKITLAWKRAVPLISISTQDQPASIQSLLPSYPPQLPIFQWDIVRGLTAANRSAEPIAENFPKPEIFRGESGLVETLSFLREEEEMSQIALILFIHNAPRSLADLAVIQSLSLSRDWAKKGGLMGEKSVSSQIILLGPSFSLPPELTNDFLSLTDPPPGEEELSTLITNLSSQFSLPTPDETTLKAGSEALLSLSQFAAEQEIALSVSKSGIDVEELGNRRRARVNEVKGLEMWSGSTTFADVGGYSEIKQFLTRLANGPLDFRSIFFIDEIEKGLGSTSDSSGVSLRMLGTLLSYMSDNNVSGILLHGIPGAGKTAVSQACSKEFNLPFISASLSAMQDSLVGKSEENLRRALEIDKSISRGRSLWIATCNEISLIPSPLLRRFDLGTFTFSLPTQDELASIWPIHLAGYGLDTNQPLPDSIGWTGAEIRACCKKSFALGIPVLEAAKFVIPLSVSNPEVISKCHKEASGKLLSASYPGPFQLSKSTKEGRSIQLEKESEKENNSPSLVIVQATPNPFQFNPGPPETPLPKKNRIGFGDEED